MKTLRALTLAAAFAVAGCGAVSAGALPVFPLPSANAAPVTSIACGPYRCFGGGFGWRYGPGVGFRRFGGFRRGFGGPGFGGPRFGGRGFGPGFGGGFGGGRPFRFGGFGRR